MRVKKDPMPTLLRRVDAANALANRIAEHIRERNLGLDAHLSAQELADQFGASRTPVNRALRILETAGLLVHRSNRGFFVARTEAAEVGAEDTTNLGEVDRIYRRISIDRLRNNLPNAVRETYLLQRYGLTKPQLALVLARIEREGWIERRAGYGWEFTETLTTPEALAQTFRMRRALEPAALLEPGYRLDRERAAQCRQVEIDLLNGGIERISGDDLFLRGARFHELLVAGGNNPYMLEAVRRLNRLRRLILYQATEYRRQYREHCEEHIALIDLLLADRNEEASELLRRHIETAENNYALIRDVLDVGPPST